MSESITVNRLKAGRDVHQTNIQGDYHVHHGPDGWATLSGQIDCDALPDAASRLRARCHPGTRKAILHRITTWMDDQDTPSCKVMWLHGSVGLGKSAIAEEIANPSLRRCAASYFFSPRQEIQAISGNLFIKTIVYQLGLCIPDFKNLIIESLAEDPNLLTKTIESLLGALVINPITNLRSSVPALSPVIVIDGLDQSTSTALQLDIIHKVIGALENHPFRFLVTSRPEQHLREAFCSPTLKAITETISLDGYPGAGDDIRLFLAEGFADILRRRADVMSHVARPWPTPSDISYFVSKASGQFLYATTVLQYLNAAETLPTDQLTALKSPISNSFSSLDELYLAILNSCHQPNQTLLKRVLTMMHILHCPQGPEVYEDLLGAPRGLVTVTLSKMHSIIRVPNLSETEIERAYYNSRAEYNHTQGLRLRHETFRDFLQVPDRSGQYSLQLAEERKALIPFVIREFFVKPIANAHPAEDAAPPRRETWGYLKEHLHKHLIDSEINVLQSALEDMEESACILGSKQYPPECGIPSSTIYAITTVLTTVAKIIIKGPPRVKSEQRLYFNGDHSHWASDAVLNEIDLLQRGNDTLDDRLKKLYRDYGNLLDKVFASVLRSSPEVCTHLPALLVSCKRAIPVQWLQDMFGEDLSTIPKSAQDAILYQWASPLWARYSSTPDITTDVVSLSLHFQAFAWDADRCAQFYQSPEKVQAAAFRQILRRVFSTDWLLQNRSFEALSFLDKILKSLLGSKIFDTPSDAADDPRVLVLKDLVSMDYCVSALNDSPSQNVKSAWQIMLKLLRWLYDQRKEARKQENNDFAKLLQDASDNIYGQILAVEAGDKGYPVVTVIKPVLGVVARDHPSMSRHPSEAGSLISVKTSKTPDATPKPTRALASILDDGTSPNHVSETLLLCYGVRHSLDSFLKSPERASALHVQPNRYHTQLAEICLKLCHSGSGSGGKQHVDNDDRVELDGAAAVASGEKTDWRTPIAQRAWEYHLLRAQPTSRLLSLLRTMQPGDWLAGGSLHRGSKDKDDLKRSAVGTIINWLKDLTKQPLNLIQRWEKIQDELPRRKGGSSILQRKNVINPMQSSTSSATSDLGTSP